MKLGFSGFSFHRYAVERRLRVQGLSPPAVCFIDNSRIYSVAARNKMGHAQQYQPDVFGSKDKRSINVRTSGMECLYMVVPS